MGRQTSLTINKSLKINKNVPTLSLISSAGALALRTDNGKWWPKFRPSKPYYKNNVAEDQVEATEPYHTMLQSYSRGSCEWSEHMGHSVKSCAGGCRGSAVLEGLNPCWHNSRNMYAKDEE